MDTSLGVEDSDDDDLYYVPEASAQFVEPLTLPQVLSSPHIDVCISFYNVLVIHSQLDYTFSLRLITKGVHLISRIPSLLQIVTT